MPSLADEILHEIEKGVRDVVKVHAIGENAAEARREDYRSVADHEITL